MGVLDTLLSKVQPKAPTMAEVVASLSADEKAELQGYLTPPAPPATNEGVAKDEGTAPAPQATEGSKASVENPAGNSQGQGEPPPSPNSSLPGQAPQERQVKPTMPAQPTTQVSSSQVVERMSVEDINKAFEDGSINAGKWWV